MKTKYVFAHVDYLEQPGEDVKLKDRNIVVAGEIYGGLEGHGLQSRADGVKFVKRLTKRLPRHNSPKQYMQKTLL